MHNVIKAFDRFLGERNLTFQATVVGGAVLIIKGLIDRVTQDLDCLDPHIPQSVKDASVEFSRSYSASGHFLKEDDTYFFQTVVSAIYLLLSAMNWGI